MPIKIYSQDDLHELAWLCDKDWNLAPQVCALEEWLNKNKAGIESGHYIADIGFCVREDAAAGGAAISPEMMRTMADLGMRLFLSEYPHVEEK